MFSEPLNDPSKLTKEESTAEESAKKLKLPKQKVSVVGDKNSGKTTLLKRITENKFTGNILATIGQGFFNKTYTVKIDDNDVDLPITLRDVGGQETTEAKSLSEAAQGSSLVLFCVSANENNLKEEQTEETAYEIWKKKQLKRLKELRKHNKHAPIYLIVTQWDSELEKEVTKSTNLRDKFEKFATYIGIPIENIKYTSAKDGLGIDTIDKIIVDACTPKNSKGNKERVLPINDNQLDDIANVVKARFLTKGVRQEQDLLNGVTTAIRSYLTEGYNITELDILKLLVKIFEKIVDLEFTNQVSKGAKQNANCVSEHDFEEAKFKQIAILKNFYLKILSQIPRAYLQLDGSETPYKYETEFQNYFSNATPKKSANNLDENLSSTKENEDPTKIFYEYGEPNDKSGYKTRVGNLIGRTTKWAPDALATSAESIFNQINNLDATETKDKLIAELNTINQLYRGNLTVILKLQLLEEVFQLLSKEVDQRNAQESIFKSLNLKWTNNELAQVDALKKLYVELITKEPWDIKSNGTIVENPINEALKIHVTTQSARDLIDFNRTQYKIFKVNVTSTRHQINLLVGGAGRFTNKASVSEIMCQYPRK